MVILPGTEVFTPWLIIEIRGLGAASCEVLEEESWERCGWGVGRGVVGWYSTSIDHTTV
jgi:hypothetical protein